MYFLYLTLYKIHNKIYIIVFILYCYYHVTESISYSVTSFASNGEKFNNTFWHIAGANGRRSQALAAEGR